MYAGEFAPVIGDGGYGCGSVGGRGRVSVDRGEDAAYFGVEELGAAVWHSHRHRLLAVPSGFPGPGVDVLKDVGVDPQELREFERRMAFVRVNELDRNPDLVTGDFDFPHLQRDP